MQRQEEFGESFMCFYFSHARFAPLFLLSSSSVSVGTTYDLVGVRGSGAVRDLLFRSAPEDHGSAPDDMQDLQQQVRSPACPNRLLYHVYGVYKLFWWLSAPRSMDPIPRNI